MSTTSDRCPSCGEKGRKVGRQTVAALTASDADLPAAGQVRFCRTRGCSTVYFLEDRVIADVAALTVPVFQKSDDPARLVCYCFEHSVAEIEAQVRATGDSDVPARVTDKCKQGLDRCAETNPQGACCLGNLRGVVREAQALLGVSLGAEAPEEHGCCSSSSGCALEGVSS